MFILQAHMSSRQKTYGLSSFCFCYFGFVNEILTLQTTICALEILHTTTVMREAYREKRKYKTFANTNGLVTLSTVREPKRIDKRTS